MTRKERLYKSFINLIGNSEVMKKKEHIKLSSSGFMDLHIEYLFHDPESECDIYSMTHYFEQNGDLVPDPDIQLMVNDKGKSLTAFAIQHSTGHYSDSGRLDGQVDMKVENEINSFLDMWFKNIKFQGFVR